MATVLLPLAFIDTRTADTRGTVAAVVAAGLAAAAAVAGACLFAGPGVASREGQAVAAAVLLTAVGVLVGHLRPIRTWRLLASASTVACGGLGLAGRLADATFGPAGTGRGFGTAYGMSAALVLLGIAAALAVLGRRRQASIIALVLLPFAAAAAAASIPGGWTIMGGYPAGWLPTHLCAWGLLAATAVLACIAFAGRRPGIWMLVWATGVLVATLGLLAVAGQWMAPSLLPLNSRAVSVLGPLGLVILGMSLTGASPRSPWESSRRTLLFPAAMGLLVVVVSVMLWGILERQRSQLEAALDQSQRDGLATLLEDGMDMRVKAIQRMARRFAVLDDPAHGGMFDLDASQYLDDLSGLRAIGYADGDRILRHTLARPTIEVNVGTRLDADPVRRRVFDEVDADGNTRLSAPMQLLLGQPGELIVAPVPYVDGRRGYVVGVVVFDRLFPALLESQRGMRDLRVTQDGRTIYQRGGLHPVSMPSAPIGLPIYGEQWQLQLGSPTEVPGQRPAQLVLLLGFALAGLLTVTLRFSALARERARLAESMRDELHEQVHVREAIQAALVDAERDMVAVLESISDGVFMVDPSWRFTYVNPQAAEMLHADPSSLLDVSCWAVLGGLLDQGELDGPLHRAWKQAMREARPVTTDATREADDRCYELRAYPHARGLTVYLHDVSARKQRERELLKRDADSRHALQLANMGSWELYLRSGYLHWSAEACAIFGVDESPGAKGIDALRRMVHPDDWAGLEDDQRRLELGEERIERRYRLIRPDGEVRVILAVAELVAKDGDPIVAGAVQDITEQERAREVLSQALEATTLVMDSAPDIIVVLDREARLLRVSAAAERLWGYPRDKLVGESITRFVHPDDVAATLEAVAGIAAGEPNPNFRNRNLAKDGRELHMQWSGIWSERSQCLYAVGRDHSDLHRAEEMDAAQRRVLTAIASGQPLSDVLEAIVLAYEAQQPESVCSILLLRDGRLHHGAAPHLPRQYMKAIDGAPIGPEAGSCGTAAWRRERVVVSDIAVDPLWQDYASLALPVGLLACWSTPILARDGAVLGTFAVYYGEAREPIEAELASIDGLAALASIALEHEHAFRQLSESEQRFRSLFDHHPDAVLALDGVGRVLQSNAAASAMLGFAPGELQQRQFTRLLSEEDRVRVDGALAAASGGEASRLQVGVSDGSGGVFPGYLVTLPIVVEGQAHGLFAVLQDQRELHQAQQGMANQLAMLSAVAESVGEGLLAVDAEGVPTFLNRTAARLLELPIDGLPHPGALPVEVRDALAGILQGRDYASDDDAAFVLASDRRVDVAYVATPLRAGGRLAGAVLAFRDIGDIKQARQSLRERQRFFELSLEVFCILDAGSGYFVQANPAFCRLLGYDEATLLGIPLGELVHPQDRMATEDAVTWQFESGEPVAGFVNRMRRSDGGDVWLEWTSRRSPEGLIFAVARDVTAKRQADIALAKAMEDLRIRNRELQDFAYVASHDLQEPLRKIQTFSDRLQSRLSNQLDASSRDYLQRMGDAASRMQTLIDDLLAYSRVGTRTTALAEVDLSRELETVLDDLDARVQEAGATVEADRLPILHADPSQMRQLMQNLLANALKFRAAGRPARIRVSARPLGEYGTTVERWELVVEDNGIGFEPAYAERIFAPFQRLHPRNVYSGTGIGLAIVRRIVERHGGTVHAEGRSGEGARFVVVLPARVPVGPARATDDAPLLNMDLPGARS